MENVLSFVQNQFAISQSGISVSWMVIAVVALFFVGKSKVKTRKS